MEQVIMRDDPNQVIYRDGVETPSGKGASDENFPVGSWILPKDLRPAVAVFYDFARASDDVADNPALSGQDKIDRLNQFEKALDGIGEAMQAVPKAGKLHDLCLKRDISLAHGYDLLTAFRQDAVKNRYESWAELRDYCQHSASPVGRFLLDLHGESPLAWDAADGLCDALQVLNHLQDCGKDYAAMDRVYLPQDMMRRAGITNGALGRDKCLPGLRKVIDECLDQTDDLIALARTLPEQLRSRRLAAESAIIVFLARRLSHLLRRQDPIARRVKLSKLDFALGLVYGIAVGFFGKRNYPPFDTDTNRASDT